MKNSNFTLDEIVIYSSIICCVMAGIVLASEKAFSGEDKPKVLSSNDIEMQKTKPESKKTVKKTLK